MKRYLIHVDTAWCGMDNSYAIETDSKIEDLQYVAQELAFDNFSSFGCELYVMEELFPEVENEEDYTDEMWDTYNKVEAEYYYYNIDEFEGSDEEFDEYDKI